MSVAPVPKVFSFCSTEQRDTAYLGLLEVFKDKKIRINLHGDLSIKVYDSQNLSLNTQVLLKILSYSGRRENYTIK